MNKIILVIGLLLSSFIDGSVGTDKNEAMPSIEAQNLEAKSKYGIKGQTAPELDVPLWIDGEGRKLETSPSIQANRGKMTVVYCFQSWCPGCHSAGLPSLQKMVKAFDGNEQIEFLAIQTVFEGAKVNTYEKMIATQKQYDLHIPFGHDTGNARTGNRSSTLVNYRTGGTPWFIFIDKEGEVIFNDFHLDTDKAIDFLKQEIKS